MAGIRAAGPPDLEAVMGLFRELAEVQKDWRIFPPRADFDQDMETKYRGALTDPDALLLVAVDEEPGGDEIVGMALGHLHRPSLFSEELAVELSSVIVRPSCRGRGIGRALAGEIGRFAASRGARYVTLRTFAQNVEATRFWERVGFEPRAIQMVAPAERLGALRQEG